MRADASAPHACEMAVLCGTAVIGISTARGTPMAAPSSSATMIHW